VLLLGNQPFGAKRWIPPHGKCFRCPNGEVDYNHCMARSLPSARSDKLDLRDLIKAGLLVGVPLVLILKQPESGHSVGAVRCCSSERFWLLAVATYGGDCPPWGNARGAVFIRR